MDVSPQPQTQVRDIKAKRLEKKRLDSAIPWAEQKLVEMIQRRASIEAVIIKVEAYELANNHDGLCGRTQAEVQLERDQATNEVPDFYFADEDVDIHAPCKRFYGHTGLHSWEGGGEG